MATSINIQIKPEFVDKIKSGYPLILKEFLSDWSKIKEEGCLLNLHDSKNNFIAKHIMVYKTKGMAGLSLKRKTQL